MRIAAIPVLSQGGLKNTSGQSAKLEGRLASQDIKPGLSLSPLGPREPASHPKAFQLNHSFKFRQTGDDDRVFAVYRSQNRLARRLGA
jgi:hypothetical protein